MPSEDILHLQSQPYAYTTDRRLYFEKFSSNEWVVSIASTPKHKKEIKAFKKHNFLENKEPTLDGLYISKGYPTLKQLKEEIVKIFKAEAIPNNLKFIRENEYLIKEAPEFLVGYSKDNNHWYVEYIGKYDPTISKEITDLAFDKRCEALSYLQSWLKHNKII